MPVETCRKIGALVGLSLGFGLMYALGTVDLIRAFCFGVGGCLAGSLTAETWGRRRESRGGSYGPSESQGPDESRRPGKSHGPGASRGPEESSR